MSKALDVLRHRIAVCQPFADNENYDIGLTIKEGNDILAEFTKEPEPTKLAEKLRQCIKVARGGIPELNHLPSAKDFVDGVIKGYQEAADLLDTQQAEIERLKNTLLWFRKDLEKIQSITEQEFFTLCQRWLPHLDQALKGGK